MFPWVNSASGFTWIGIPSMQLQNEELSFMLPLLAMLFLHRARACSFLNLLECLGLEMQSHFKRKEGPDQQI